MLKEFAQVSQHPGERRRRWFRSEDEDLIIWYDEDGSIYGFQLCYDQGKSEKALTWIRGLGYSHLKVDQGEVDPLTFKRTPMLVADGIFNSKEILQRFISIGSALPEDVFSFVKEKIRHYP